MELFINNLILLSVTSSIFIVLTHLVYSLSKDRYTAKWKYYIWLILAIRLLIPLDISIKSLSFNVPTFQSSTSNNEVFIKENFPNESLNHTFDNLTNVPDNNLKNTSNQTFENTTHKEEISKTKKTKVVKTLSPYQIAFIIWLSGILVFTGIDIIKYCIFKRKLKRWSLSINKGRYNELLLDSLNKMKINNPVNLYVSKTINTPMLAGIIKPSIYIPHENYSPEELEIIIKHELIHYKRRDLLYKLLLMFAKDVHWFNPFVHFMAIEANKDLELICDEEMVKNKDFEYRERYSKILLDSASAAKSQVHLATGIFGGAKTIKRRFANILNARQYKKGYKFTAGIALLLIVSNLFVSCGEKVGISPQPGEINNTVTRDLWDLPEEDESLAQRMALRSYGADMPVLVYASDKIAIVSDYWGIAVYDLVKERLSRVVDLISINMSHTQGDLCRIVSVNKEGTHIIIKRMFKNPKNPVPTYLYDIEKDKLEITQQEEFKEYPDNLYSDDNKEVQNLLKDTVWGSFNYNFAKIGPDKWIGLKYDVNEWNDMRSLYLYVFDNGNVSKKQIFSKYNDLPPWPTEAEIMESHLSHIKGGKRYEDHIIFEDLTAEEVMKKFREGNDWTYIETEDGMEKYKKKIGNYDVIIGVNAYTDTDTNETILYIRVVNN